jgi:hypothetical protein
LKASSSTAEDFVVGGGGGGGEGCGGALFTPLREKNGLF